MIRFFPIIVRSFKVGLLFCCNSNKVSLLEHTFTSS